MEKNMAKNKDIITPPADKEKALIAMATDEYNRKL